MSARPTPKPWPMKWIVLTIVLFIAAYTFITLYFRKPGPGYQPYQSARERETVQRLTSAGYQRIEATAQRPAEPKYAAASLGGNLATIVDLPGGLSAELREAFPQPLALPEGFGAVHAPRVANVLMPYSVHFVCALPDTKAALTDTWAFLKNDELAIVTGFEPLDGGLLARSKEGAVLLTFPPGALQPGTYRVTLFGARTSRQWTLQVH